LNIKIRRSEGIHIKFPFDLLILTLFSLLGCSRNTTDGDAIANVRLGMAPRDVRERFQPGGAGTWRTALGAGDDTVLEWTAEAGAKAATSALPPSGAPQAVSNARFEFHLAMLVAIRAHLTAPPPDADQASATAKTVTLRSRSPASEGGTDVTVLARDCPTHHDEAESLAARAKR
jgi:hypothetical protein